MAPTTATLAQPLYQRRMRQLFVDAYRRAGHSPQVAQGLANVASTVVAGEFETAAAWGKDCVSCAFLLDRVLAGYTEAERAGVELFAHELDKIIKAAREQWDNEGLRLEHIEAGVTGFLFHYHAHAGKTFEIPRQTATPELPDR